jgi:cell pole-organizing protein PopZ
MSDQTAQEPTMEEILASIRRIISEDDAPAAEAAAAPQPAPEPEPSPAMMDETPSVQAEPEDDVLELTQRYEEPAPEPAPAPMHETIGDIEAAPRWEEPAAEPEALFVAPTPTNQTAAPAPAAAPFTGVVTADTTIGELVRSILEPQIRDWAAQNLDGIMRDLVREKLERVFK